MRKKSMAKKAQAPCTYDEQSAIMMLAYFYGRTIYRQSYTTVASQMMKKNVASTVLANLIKRHVVRTYGGYNNNAYVSLENYYLFYGLQLCVLPENKDRLLILRKNYNSMYYGRLPSEEVSNVFHILNPRLKEAASSVSIHDLKNLVEPLAGLIERSEFASIWKRVPTQTMSDALAFHCNMRLLDDAPINWDVISKRVKEKENSIADGEEGKNIVRGTYLLYRYLDTGILDYDILALPITIETTSLAAIQKLYAGDVKMAYQLFSEAMKIKNRAAANNDEKSIFEFFVLNYYYALTQLLYGKADSAKRLRSLASKVKLRGSIASELIIGPICTYFIEKKELNYEKSLSMNSHFEVNRGQYGANWLSWMIIEKMGAWPSHVKAPSLTEHQPRAAWLRQELSPMGIIPENEQPQALFGGTPVFSRLAIKSVWQMKLEQIIELTSEQKPETEERETWLQYFIAYNNISVVQRRRLKSGSWSAGRTLSTKTFSTLPQGELDENDKRLQSIVKAWDYYINLDDAIFCLTGCDHVFVGDQYDYKQVSVHEDKPYLIIDKNRNGSFRVSSNIVDVEGEPGKGKYYKKNSETDYSVIYVSPFEEKVYRQILSQQTYPAEAEQLLLKLMSAIGGRTEIHSNMVQELDNVEKVNAPSLITLRCEPQGPDEYQLTALARPFGNLQFVPGQGNVTTIAEHEGKKVQVVRNLKTERRNLKTITEALQSLDGVDEDLDFSEVNGQMQLRMQLGQLLDIMPWTQNNKAICQLEWPEDAHLKYHPQIGTPAASVNIKSRASWFEMEGEVRIDDEHVLSLQKLLELMHAQSRGKYIKIDDNEYITLSRDLQRLLRRIDTVTTEQRQHLQMAPAAVSVLSDLLGDAAYAGIFNHEAIDSLLARIRESSKQEPKVPRTLKADLRDYQVEGFEWLSRLTAWGAGACLADDMGLGKTLQTIALLLEQKAEGASLVVAPASVVPNWRAELSRFAPTLSVTLLNQAENREEAIKEATAGDIVVTTYALLNTEQEHLTEKEWNVVCLDEAHTIKNPNTKMSKAAMRLKAQRKVILTGTPIQNHLSELWNLFQFINPGLLGSAEQFSKKFIQPIEGDHDKERQNQLRRLIMPFMLRRTKGEVIEELPEKNEIQVPVELTGEEMTLYEVYRRKAENAVKADEKVGVSTLAEITRLRQLACSCSLVDNKWKKESSKVQAFIDLAESLNDSGNRALVFSQFTSFFQEVRLAMDRAKLPYLYLDGSTPMAQREKLVKEFQSGRCPFFLISLKAGGLGLNLTGANYVVHLDPWWNPAVEQQATDRAYRIGQKQDVTVYHLIAEHTIEEKIVRLHKTKRDLADQLLEGADMAHALTQEELLELLQDK